MYKYDVFPNALEMKELSESAYGLMTPYDALKREIIIEIIQNALSGRCELEFYYPVIFLHHSNFFNKKLSEDLSLLGYKIKYSNKNFIVISWEDVVVSKKEQPLPIDENYLFEEDRIKHLYGLKEKQQENIKPKTIIVKDLNRGREFILANIRSSSVREINVKFIINNASLFLSMYQIIDELNQSGFNIRYLENNTWNITW